MRVLAGYARGERFICIIDEAQVMPVPLLEQIRFAHQFRNAPRKIIDRILVGQRALNSIKGITIYAN